jgi:hypothetical protein
VQRECSRGLAEGQEARLNRDVGAVQSGFCASGRPAGVGCTGVGLSGGTYVADTWHRASLVGVAAVYRSDVVLHCLTVGEGQAGRTPRRGVVWGLSRGSVRRLRFKLANYEGEWAAWLDLTYPAEFPRDGRIVKAHLEALLKRLKRRYPGIVYLWVLEFQERGAPHYHIVVSCRVGKGWLSQAWYEIVGSGEPAHLRAGTRVSAVRSNVGMAGYFAKYLGKRKQKAVPSGFVSPGRMWGCSRGISRPVLEFVLEGAQLVEAQRLFRKLLASRGCRSRRVFRHGRGGVAFRAAGVGERIGSCLGLRL